MKILLAEDTADLNRAVSAVLNMEHYDVDSVFDGEEAISRILSESYDVIILDIMMPKADGLTVLRTLRERHITTPVMLLTAKAEIDDRVTGLDAGADDYLPKPFAMKELLARVRSLLRRYTEYKAEELSCFDLLLGAEGLSLSARNTVQLSIHEYELMELLIRNAGKALSTDYLIERVWKNEDGAGEDTVWLYISYLKGKLRAVGSSAVISGMRGGSFMLSGDET